ncbi:sugar ABC transporter substrate-binding protein [Roseovarius sp.]|jgi:ribose transport system substrate-binding protein|uniref:sugar ABC transporter substrate-binding protein n=1 Tax=Roseovarius sp. TaxID=1486281 RepID=UPI002637C26E|nr:sugar ABC transporter substrate-binding protein [Roseovarius sp.]MDM8166689.1 sugar ABC transporter substrate-binding protein [Roseovarius sp.]
MKHILKMATVAAALAAPAWAEKPDDGLVHESASAMEGKTVAYVPIAMGFDLTEAWASGLRKDAEAWGYNLTIRDPNWSVDAGAQALSQLITEKPDVIVVHPPEIQAYARLLKQAARAGIPVITMNLKASENTDYFIGADWYDIAVQQTEQLIEICGKSNGGSGQVAVIQGVLTNPTSQYGMMAIEATMAAHEGELEMVSNQAADWDASKAHAIATTVLKANPDLCGFAGMWDNMDVGIAAAIKEAGKQGDVHVVTSGGGNKDSACDNVENGNFDSYISYDAAGQARDLMMAVRAVLQNPPEEAAAHPVAVYTPLKTITKESLYPGACWSLDDLNTYGP